MEYKIKRLDMYTGYPLIAVLNKKDADLMDLYSLDRVRIKKGRKQINATLDTTNSDKFVKQGEVGMFSEGFQELGVKKGSKVHIYLEKKPKSVELIKKKLKGARLNYDEIHTIINDISRGLLNEIEITYFVAGSYINKLSFNETVALTKAMINTGEVIKFNKKIVVDKHCIGGVAGNRTTPIVVAILAAAGLTIPKTSSRSITSAAGTADTVEVFCKVDFPIKKLKQIVNKTNGCLAWGGALNLAPSDDRIIRVEHPLSMDPTGQLIASILSKKRSVSATHVLIDIPVGRGAKIEKMKDAIRLKKKFIEVSRKIGLKIKVFITQGSQPIGNGIGPMLEAREILYILKNSSYDNYHLMLKRKCLHIAGDILELTKKVKKCEGYHYAKGILESGAAYEKFKEIIKEQNGKLPNPDKMKLARYNVSFKANKSGRIAHIDNNMMNKIARIAGAPNDKEAGVYLYKHKKDIVKKGDKIFTLYSDNKKRLEYAKKEFSWEEGIEIKKNHHNHKAKMKIKKKK
ncbi:AMP phosphorylase [Candidatus Woesearchaeota archaeon]|nr:AMP phosphorylase [Candidatus Woesearchaeota archaeon]